jgi:hypothetical protein
MEKQATSDGLVANIVHDKLLVKFSMMIKQN